MDTLSTHDGKPPTGERIVVTVGDGLLTAFPVEAVGRMAVASQAAPVPFAPPAYEGIVVHAGTVAPQIDLVAATGGAPRSGAYALLIRTDRGPVLLRVAAVSFPEADYGDLPAAMPKVDGLVAVLVPAAADGSAPPDPPCDAEPETFPLFIVRTADHSVAFPAQEVVSIARHDGAWRIRKGGADERVVEIGGCFLPGHSLAQWLGLAAETTNEAWVAILAAAGHRLAVAFAEPVGIVAAPRTRLRRLLHRDHATHHYVDPARGAIEIVGAAEFGRSGGTVETPLDDGDAAIDGPVEMDVASPDGGLAATAGPYICVFPGGTVSHMMSGVRPDDLPIRRPPHGWPVFDLAALLGAPRGAAAANGRMIVLNRADGRCPVVLLVSSAGPADPVSDWHPLPMVPPAVRALFSSVRQSGPVLQFLVRATLLAGRPDPALVALVTPALLGWLEPERRDEHSRVGA